MTAEKIAILHKKIAAKLKNASGAAEYLKEKAARCTDAATKAILTDLQFETEEKAERLGALSRKLLNKYYDQKYGGMDNFIRTNNPEYYSKYLA